MRTARSIASYCTITLTASWCMAGWSLGAYQQPKRPQSSHPVGREAAQQLLPAATFLPSQDNGVAGDAGAGANHGRHEVTGRSLRLVGVGVDTGKISDTAPSPMVMPPRSLSKARWRMVTPSPMWRL